MMHKSVFVHVVTCNDRRYISLCLKSLLEQEKFTVGRNLTVLVTDNASSDNTVQIVEQVLGNSSTVLKNSANMGFAAGHNQGAALFLASNANYFVILNPDVRLRQDALQQMVEAFDAAKNACCVAPLLYRADENLMPLDPPLVDAAGMYFSRAIRHLDRGSGECDIGQYSEACSVSGASGACLMLERSVVCALLLQGERHDKDVFKIYPALEENYLRRAPLFDEAFFAYREDADLAWRASILGCRTHFAPSVVGYHRRRVTPENRASLPPEINRWSVRNRFLMQINNFSIRRDATALWRGVILRNCLVVAGVALRERSSLGAFKDLAILLPRALERRRLLFKRANNSQLRNMFSNR